MSELKKTYEEVVKNIITNLQDKENTKFVLEQIDLLVVAFSRRNGKSRRKNGKINK